MVIKNFHYIIFLKFIQELARGKISLLEGADMEIRKWFGYWECDKNSKIYTV